MTPLGKKWHHGSITFFDKVIWVMETVVGGSGMWFAAMPDEGSKLELKTGPWPTQEEAEKALADWLNALIKQAE